MTPARETWRAWLGRRDPVAATAVVLAVLYAARYLDYPALPGNDPPNPAGWWNWWDQGKYLASAAAFADLNLDPGRHYYPLGYALLGAPFAGWAPMHAFFFVDLASLVGALCAFVSFARRCRVPAALACLLFLLSEAGDWALFQQWVVPWNTTPEAAAIWTLLALAAAHLDGERRPALLGLAAASVAALRPTDAILAAPAILICLAADRHAGVSARRGAARLALGAGLPALLYMGLYATIYGPHRTEYMRVSAHIGFTLHQAGWKAWMLLADPAPWIGTGEGLLRRCPWMLLGVAGLLPALLRRTTAMLAATLTLHGLLYLAYADLTAMGLWRYLNVHYYTWVFPGFALTAVLLLRDLLAPAWTRRAAAGAGLSVAGLLACLRVDPVPAAPGQSAQAVDFPAAPGFQGVYIGALRVTDSAGSLSDGADIRAVALPGAVRVLALKRSLNGPAAAVGAGLDGAAGHGLHAAVRFGWPAWPRAVPGEFAPR